MFGEDFRDILSVYEGDEYPKTFPRINLPRIRKIKTGPKQYICSKVRELNIDPLRRYTAGPGAYVFCLIASNLSIPCQCNWEAKDIK
jgi:hypothetical protein